MMTNYQESKELFEYVKRTVLKIIQRLLTGLQSVMMFYVN